MYILSNAEKNVLKILLNKLDNNLSNNGCNDFELEATPENLSLIEKAECMSFGYNDDLESFKKSTDYKNRNGISTKYYTQDFILLNYLRKKLGV